MLTIDTTEVQRIARNYYEQLHAKKLDKLSKMVKTLETYNLPKLNQEESENLNRLVTRLDYSTACHKIQTKGRFQILT